MCGRRRSFNCGHFGRFWKLNQIVKYPSFLPSLKFLILSGLNYPFPNEVLATLSSVGKQMIVFRLLLLYHRWSPLSRVFSNRIDWLTAIIQTFSFCVSSLAIFGLGKQKKAIQKGAGPLLPLAWLLIKSYKVAKLSEHTASVPYFLLNIWRNYFASC